MSGPEAQRRVRPTAARLTVVTAALVGVSACAGGASDGAADPNDPSNGAPAGVESMEVDVTTDRETYDSGEPIGLTLTVRNGADTVATLDFTSSQRYDFQILDASGASAWTWSADRGFLQVLGTETVDPGGELSWTETAAGVELEPGTYTVVGTVTSRSGGLSDRTTVTVR